MKKIILSFFSFFIYSFSSLIESNISKRSVQVLEDLDIKSSFITDYYLQEMYSKYQNNRDYYYYISKLNDASLFVPRVKDILRQEGIPSVFIYMAMAESNFSINAKSSVKATGLWQFMDTTGRKYGLRNDKYVDERMDLIKSTVAATKYLNSLHKRFDKWYLAAISYNCGEGRVIEAITRATIDSYVKKFPDEKRSEKIQKFRTTIKAYQERKVPFFKLGRIYKEVLTWNIELDVNDLLTVQDGLERQYLPKESRIYIRKIIALAMMNSLSFIKEKKNSHLLNMGISTTIATVPVKGGLHLRNIAKSINMTYENLLGLNRHIKQSIIPPTDKYYTINIPYNKLNIFNQNRDSIKDSKFAVHIVKKGDTLSYISNKYKLAISLIKDYNNFKTNTLSLGQKIILPILSDMASEIKSVTKKKIREYTVKSGDSLSSIARKHDIAIDKLMKNNKMKSTIIKIGDRLVLN